MRLMLNKYLAYSSVVLMLAFQLSFYPLSARADELPEYRLKAAFLYNFASFTEWPENVGENLMLCTYDEDPFGRYLDELQGEKVGDRSITINRINKQGGLKICHVIFITRSVSDKLSKLIKDLNGKPVLTVADTPNATSKGVAINMDTHDQKVTFTVNMVAARNNDLSISSRLLRLASKVIQ